MKKRSIWIIAIAIALLCAVCVVFVVICNKPDEPTTDDPQAEQTPGGGTPDGGDTPGEGGDTPNGGDTPGEGGSASGGKEPAHTHTYGEWRVTTPATCADGVETRTCGCGDSETRPIAAVSSHRFTVKEQTEAYLKIEANCKTPAQYYWKCAQCDAHATNTYTVGDIGGHRMDENHVCIGCSNSYIYFGEYPQSLKAEDVTVSETTDSRGYYLGSDNAYYAKVVAFPCGSGYKFSNGSAVTSGTTYYFKVEPILWRILAQEDGTALLLCNSIIDNKTYHSSGSFANDSNVYSTSSIRSWLNGRFYDTAFGEDEQAMIVTTTVDNSVASTGYTNNKYACKDTDDKIFLLSYVEANNESYGFGANSDLREMQTSDYSRATGAYMSTDQGDYGNGYWWLRSPYYNEKETVLQISSTGGSKSGDAGRNGGGVVPALQIVLP